MKKIKLIWYLFPSYLVVVLVSLFAETWYASDTLRDFFIQQSKADLEARAKILETQILPHLSPKERNSLLKDLDEFCKQSGQNSATRITVVLISGKVVGDSEENPSRMDNHADRPEVRKALAGTVGTSTRYSDTLQQDMMYVAIPLKEGEEIKAALRTSFALSRIAAKLHRLRRKIMMWGVVLAAGATVLSYGMARMITRPLEKMEHGVVEHFSFGKFDYRLPVPHTEEMGALAEAMNDMAGQIQNRMQVITEQNEKLDQLASVDGLTSLANRRQYDKFLSQEWKRMKRNKQWLTLILCDVDFFKRYNDTYGHQRGDTCLVSVAAAIKQGCQRPGDLAARYGGEEFAIILPNTSIEGGVKLAETIRQRIAGLHLSHQSSGVADYVTMSFGVAGCVPTEALDPQDLVQRADEALYQAKDDGRNRVASLKYS